MKPENEDRLTRVIGLTAFTMFVIAIGRATYVLRHFITKHW